MTTLPPHEDDLREFATALRAAVVSAEAAVSASADGDDPGPDLTAAVERTWDALRGLGQGVKPRCPTCGGSGLIANDINCGCPAGDRYRAVPVAAPTPEVGT
jgi:hypothetical protein